ncbi:glycoside hydrolase family 88 protein [Pedobacter sp. SYSU D00535]|uniref:glycoside hydrolase family 88 protein n=1 Tax=Pedobacter sp. SYSU D00535 TaxID=2810308 RepID=UPI001A9718CD|nr:glycoside hydrolase family 88 protein [Pedobacter sp. SYSU D00535]
MKKISVIAVLILAFSCQGLFVSAQGKTTKPVSERLAATAMERWRDSMWTGRPAKWTYDQGTVMEGIAAVWKRTGDGKYFDFIKRGMDLFIQPDGSIRTYKLADYNIDNVKNGRALLVLYKVTGQEKYLKAAQLLRQQLSTHPRTNEGGFWHKKVYPYQMWLDGLYMGQPFYAEYAAMTNDHEAFNDIARQFILMEKHSVHPATGLLYHGYDESRQQKWADKETGRSPHFWGRAMGWYGMGLVDALEYFPANHPKRDSVIAILNRFATAVQKVQDAKSGVWYDILDRPTGKGNYLESSASSMFVYALAKGIRLGYLPQSYLPVVEKGYQGLQKEFIEVVNADRVNLTKTVSVSGLGGSPYRDGSYEYYLSEKVITNDPKGVGAFILAANEMDLRAMPKPGLGKTITLDYYFNNEYKKDPTGIISRYHYTWEDNANSGFSLLGNIFKNAGASLNSLTAAPTAANLQNSDIYIIVDPDTEKETAAPNFMTAQSADELYKWVHNGGVLVLMTNDHTNAELKKFNTLSERFGIRFNEDMVNAVKNDQYETGAFAIPKKHPIFQTAKKVYIKEISTLNLSSPAKPAFTSGKNVIMASAQVGKGTVFAVGDPWFYNEYVDGRKLPAQYENFKAATDLVYWLVNQVPAR